MQGFSHSKLHVGKKNNSTLPYIGHLTPNVLKCLAIQMLGDLDVNFANVDNCYFSLLEPYAHGFIHLGTLKDRL